MLYRFGALLRPLEQGPSNLTKLDRPSARIEGQLSQGIALWLDCGLAVRVAVANELDVVGRTLEQRSEAHDGAFLLGAVAALSKDVLWKADKPQTAPAESDSECHENC